MRNDSVVILSAHEQVRASLRRIINESGFTDPNSPTSSILLPVERPGVSDVRQEVTRLPTIEDVEKLYIEHVVSETGHNISLSARILGIDRTTLYNKLRRYGLLRRATGADE